MESLELYATFFDLEHEGQVVCYERRSEAEEIFCPIIAKPWDID